MGLNFGYLLYFNQEHLWDALQGFVSLVERFDPPTKIFFPESVLEIHLEPLSPGSDGYKYNDPEMDFFACISFDEDTVLAEYLESSDQNKIQRSPPETKFPSKITICEIILSVQQKIDEDDKNQYVLFEFSTVGTWMSVLFDKSISIRNTFINFLENYDGVSAVFNYEFGGGEVLWHKGKRVNLHVDNQYLLPNEIDTLLKENHLI